MGFGFNTGALNSTLMQENIEHVTNMTSFPGFFIKVNYYMYDGWLFFIMLMLLFVIFMFVFMKNNDNFISAVTASSAIVAVLSLIARGLYIVEMGVEVGLLADFQLWIFPVISVIFALINHLMD